MTDDSPPLPPFPTDELTLSMVEHALGYYLTFEEENDELTGAGAEYSLHQLLDFLSGTSTDPLGMVELIEDGLNPLYVDERPHYTERDVIEALIAEVRRLRSAEEI